MSGFTPGPWRLAKEGCGHIVIAPDPEDDRGTCVVQLPPIEGRSDEESEANARLFAAALLGFDLAKSVVAASAITDIPTAIVFAAKEFLAKATGSEVAS